MTKKRKTVDAVLKRIGACAKARDRFRGLTPAQAVARATAEDLQWVLLRLNITECTCDGDPKKVRRCPISKHSREWFTRRYRAKLLKALSA